MTAGQLAEGLGISADAARKRLVKLRSVRLAFRDEKHKWHRVNRDLNEVARALGSAGAGESQKERHSRERLVHAMRLSAGRRSRFGAVKLFRENTVREGTDEPAARV
jgi:hypothetical protein